jgi:hypothetical protein
MVLMALVAYVFWGLGICSVLRKPSYVVKVIMEYNIILAEY